MELVRLLKIAINLLIAVITGMFVGYLLDLETMGWIAAFGVAFIILTVSQPLIDKVFLRL